MSKDLRKNNRAIKSRPTCMICGKIIKDGEDFVASRRYKNTWINGGLHMYKYYIHAKHLNKEDLKEYYLDDLAEEL